MNPKASFELVQKRVLNRICRAECYLHNPGAMPLIPGFYLLNQRSPYSNCQSRVHLLFSTSKGLRLAPTCRRRFPFSQLFSGAALSGGSPVALFSAACFGPGCYFEKVAFRGFQTGFQSCKSRMPCAPFFLYFPQASLHCCGLLVSL